jgi:arylsulfatase A-like enzyme
MMGAVLDALAASPAADNTFIIFTSDHGEVSCVPTTLPPTTDLPPCPLPPTTQPTPMPLWHHLSQPITLASRSSPCTPSPPPLHLQMHLEHRHVEKMTHYEGSARVPMIIAGTCSCFADAAEFFLCSRQNKRRGLEPKPAYV